MGDCILNDSDLTMVYSSKGYYMIKLIKITKQYII